MLFIISVRKKLTNTYHSKPKKSPYIQMKRRSLYLLDHCRPWWISKGWHCSRAGGLLQLPPLHQLVTCLECSSKSCEIRRKESKVSKLHVCRLQQIILIYGHYYLCLLGWLFSNYLFTQGKCSQFSFTSFRDSNYLNPIPSIHWVYHLVGC